MTAPEFGATSWGHGWRRVAEPVTRGRPDSSLPKARSLARRDRVGAVELAAGRIVAEVQDGRSHAVELTFPVWSADERARARPLLGAARATDDLPDELHERLRGAGLAVAPSADAVHGDCSCTAHTRPCSHVLAVAFDVARRLDERPALALVLRGAEVQPAPRASTALVPLAALDPSGFFGH